MWRRPVTFGGGMTITNRGEPAGPAGWKRPSFSHTEYHRSSKCAGSKVFSRPLDGTAASARTGFSGMKKGLSEPSHISETGRVLLDAGLELLDPLLDDDLGDVRN